RDGVDGLLEVGPHPALVLSMSDVLIERNSDAIVVGTLRRDENDEDVLVEALARLHCAGYTVNWRAFHGARGRVVSLPSYPWQRRRHWVDGPADRSRLATRKESSLSWALLQTIVSSSAQPGTTIFEVELDLRNKALAYLSGHQ